ncbi:glycosyltransferase 87 family protein [Oerskovia turbata]
MPDSTAARPASTGRRLLAWMLRSPWALVAGFVLVHAWLIFDALTWGYRISGDVHLYWYWARAGIDHGIWPVLDYDWVYPVGALAPLVIPGLVGTSVEAYYGQFVALIVVLDAVALWFLARLPGRGRIAAWWWLAFLVALGPIFLGRLDGVAAALLVISLAVAVRRPAVATAIATFGAWVKIAPGAVVVALLTTARRPWRTVVLPGAIVSAVVVALALAGGAGPRVLGVFGTQDSRGLQSESVFATPFSVLRLVDPVWRVWMNPDIRTLEILGPGTRATGRLLDLLLPLAVLVIAGISWWAVRRRPAARTDVFLLAVTALLLSLIVFNKVGSPQFVAWIGPPVAVAIALAGPGARSVWSAPALAVLATAGLTQLLYPVAYWEFTLGEPWIVLVAALRNLALVVLLIGAVVQLVRLGRGASASAASTLDSLDREPEAGPPPRQDPEPTTP